MKKLGHGLNKVQKAIFIVFFCVFMLYSLSVLFTIFTVLLESIKGNEDRLAHNFLPTTLSFQNYVNAYYQLVSDNGVNIIGMFFNSVWYSVGGALIGVLTATCLAYAVSKYRFFGRRFLQVIAIVVMVIPIVGALPSQYRIYESLNLLNSPMILISFASGFGLNYLVMNASFDNLSWSYAEAAFIDGAGHFKILFQIMLPQVFPVLTALFLVAFIGIWNDYQSPIIFMEELPTLSSGLYYYKASTAHAFMDFDNGVYYAGVSLCLIPIVIIFILFQNTIMDMSLSGGVKQ